MASPRARPAVRQLPAAVGMVRARPAGLLAKHLGLQAPGVADPAPPGAGRGRADAGRALVRGRAVQLRAPGVPACGAGPCGGLPRDHRPQRARRAPRTVLARAAPPGRLPGPAPESAGPAARRPGRGLPAQHPRGHGRLPGRGEPGRRLEHLRAGYGHACGAGPLQADRAQGPDRLRRRALRRPRHRPPGRGVRPGGGAAQREPPAGAPRPGAGHRRLARLHRLRAGHRRRRGGSRRLRAGVVALRPSPVDRLLQRHHRPAQAHRARARRHHAGDAGHGQPAQRPGLQLRRQQLGRALPLVQPPTWGSPSSAPAPPSSPTA